MKATDIKSFEIGEHCFGPVLEVNGKEYHDLGEEEVIEFIMDMFKNNLNADLLIRETFQKALEYLDYDDVEYDDDSCEQCGNHNHSSKYTVK